MLELLMTRDIEIVCHDTGRSMVADCLYVLNGEFTVYESGESTPIYRGSDFEDALEVLEGNAYIGGEDEE